MALLNTIGQWVENGLLYAFVLVASLPVYVLCMRQVDRLQRGVRDTPR